MQDKQKTLDARFREKYTRDRSSFSREKRLGVQSMMRDARLHKKQMDEQQRKLLQDRIGKEKDSQKLKERFSRTKKEELERSRQTQEQQKAIQKAKERLKSQLQKLESKTATSAHQDNAFNKIRAGNTSGGIDELAKAGKEGAFGNEMARIDRDLSEQAHIIDKNKGNGGDELRKILAANSAPMLTVNQGKYSLSEEKEQKKGMEKGPKTQQTAFTKDEFLKEEMEKRRRASSR